MDPPPTTPPETADGNRPSRDEMFRTVKWIRRHPLLAGLAFAFAVASAWLLGGWLKYTSELSERNEELRLELKRAQAERDAAKQAKQEAERARSAAEQERREAITGLSNLNSAITRDRLVRPARRNDEAVVQMPLEAYRRVVEGLDYPELRMEQSRGYHWLGKAYLQVRDFENAGQLLSRAVRVREGVDVENKRDPERSLELAVFRTDWAESLFRRRKLEAAETELQRALKIIKDPKSGPESSSLNRDEFHAMILYQLAKVQAARNKPAEARMSLQSALRVLDIVIASNRSRSFAGIRAAIRQFLAELTAKKKQQ